MENKTLRVNFFINAVGAIAPIIIALATVPIFVANIGNDRYGVVAIVWVLLGYFGFIDLGLSRASTNALSSLRSPVSDERAKVLVTSLVLNLTLACAGTVVLYFAGGYLLNHVVSVPAELQGEINSALPWIACLLPLVLVSGIALGVLESREMFLVANLIQTIGAAVGQIVPVVCAILISPSLSVVIPAAALARIFTAALLLAIVYAQEKPLRFSHFDPHRAKALLSYGGWITLSGIVTPFLNTFDQLVIGRLLGVASVTFYSVPMNLIMRSQLFTNALSRTLFPRLSSLDLQSATEIASRSLVTSAVVYGGICSGGILLYRPFIALWMGDAFEAMAGDIGTLLIVGTWVNALAFAPYTLLQGQRRPDIVAKLHLGQVLPYLGFLYIMTQSFGLIGAATAFVVRAIADCLILILLSSLPRAILCRLLPPFALLLISAAAETFLRGNLIATLVGCVAVAAATAGLLRLQDPEAFRIGTSILNRLLRLARLKPAKTSTANPKN